MRLVFLLIIALSAFSLFGNESIDPGKVIIDTEPIDPTKVIIHPSMSAADRRRVYNSFSGAPLAFIADENEKAYIQHVTEDLSDRDEYRKRMALAAYITAQNKHYDNEHGPWEDYQDKPGKPFHRYSLSAADKKRVLNSFSGDPLAFIADAEEKSFIQRITEDLSDRDEYRKRMALAAYITAENQDFDFTFNINNLDSILEKFYKKKTTVDEAYSDFQRVYGVERSSTLKEFAKMCTSDPYLLAACGFLLLVTLFYMIKLLIKITKIMLTFLLKTKRNYCALQEYEKILFCFSAATIATLAASFFDSFSGGFYIFLRWCVCVSFGGYLFYKIPAILKCILILGCVLFNPIIPIHLDDRDTWLLFDLLAIVVLTGQGAIMLWGRKNGTAQEG